MHSTTAKGKKEFLKYLCLRANKFKWGESLFSQQMLLFGINLERNEGASYLLWIIITLYGSSRHDIFITMQRSCNFQIVYFSRYSRKINFQILRASCTYMEIHMFSEFGNVLFVTNMRNMRNNHSNTVVYFIFLRSLLKQHGIKSA